MSDQSGPSHHLQTLFEAAFRDYEKQTGKALADHPLAERLQSCDTVESVTAILREQTETSSEIRGKDKVLKPLKNVLSVLHKLSSASAVNLGQHLGLPLPPLKAIHTGLGVLLSAVKGVLDDYDTLADLLESVEHFLNRLDIYNKIPPTVSMIEIIVKILVELLSILALATKQLQQGKFRALVKKKLFGGKDIEAVLQRLDRLTEDEARITAAQTLEVVYGLFQNMRDVVDDGKASINHVRHTLEIIQELASDRNKSKRDNLEQDIRRWLSPPDPWKNHNIACKSSHHGSAAWFLHGNTYPEWRASETPGSLLWVHAKAGARKSVLCSTLIEDIDAMRKAGLASLAFFYCDFREDQKKDLRGLLSSLLVQLCHQSDSYSDILFKLYSEHANGSRHPSDNALARWLKELLNLPGHAPVYLIVDALDECPNTSSIPSPRDEVLNLIGELIKSQIPHLRVCVTSRPEADIKDFLEPLVLHAVSLHEESGQKRDIEDYIQSVINWDPKNKRWKAADKQLVIKVLTEKAQGMFRWVYCQLVNICGCIPARIRHALASLPETLDGTYERTLREINKEDWEFAHRLLQFVAVAARPLDVKELAELLAFDFKAGSIPKFHGDWRLEDPVHAVLSACPSFLAIADDKIYSHRKVVQFSHFSVKEFLTSARLAESDDVILHRYHISEKPAHTLAARACLGYLLHLDKDITSSSLRNLPFTDYSAEYWVYHVRLEDVSRIVKDCLKELFDPNKSHLTVCVWLRDPSQPYLIPKWQFERSSPLRGTPLHYAALWGLHSIVELLVNEHSQDVNSRDFIGSTSLHLASKRGHLEVARALIEHGASVSTRNNDGQTPLHLVSLRDWDSYSDSGDSSYPEVTRMLIERGADASVQDKDGQPPLHLAMQVGNEKAAHLLIELGVAVSACNKDGQTPLHLASQAGRLEVARMLVDHGADMSAQNRDGQTPLHLASQAGRLEITRMLIDRDASVSAQNKDGQTPLHLALKAGRLEAARMLITLDANVSAQNKDGQTPLHLVSLSNGIQYLDAEESSDPEAVRCLIRCAADVAARGNVPVHVASQAGRLEVARMLIERGSDVSNRDKDGLTPVHLASQEGQLKVARMLIELGAGVSTCNKDGQTPLHLASQAGKLKVARMLIERGASVSAQNNDGQTPLHLASRAGRLEVAHWHMLIECGASVSARNKDGQTPLHFVSLRNGVLYLDSEEFNDSHPGVARMLIERGADVSAQDNEGQTPVQLALQAGRLKVARMLIRCGASMPAQNNDGTPFHMAYFGNSDPTFRPFGYLELTRMFNQPGANMSAQMRMRGGRRRRREEVVEEDARRTRTRR